MSKLNVLLTAALTLSVAAPHYAFAFEKIYGGPGLDRGVFVSPLSDGGFIVAGVTQSFGHGSEDIYLIRTDASGDTLWTRTYGGIGQDNGWSVHEVQDGFILAGYTLSFGAGFWDFYLVRTDSQGAVLWSQTYGGGGSDRCWALALTTDGGYLLAGETTSFGAGQEDFYIVKVDSAGAEEWSQTYGGAQGDRCFSVALANDGGYMLAGQTYSEGAGDRDAYIVKIDSGGTFEWSKTFGGPASDVGHYISRNADGSFLLTGYTTSFATVGDDPYITRIDELGNVAWTRVLPISGLHHTLTGEEASDGGFFLTGFSEYQQPRSYSALLVKADSNGNLQWHKDILPTTTGRSLGYTLRALPDGRCVFTGHTSVNSAGNFDLLLATGCLINLTGDVTADNQITSADIVRIVNYVFRSGVTPQPCEAAADTNCDGVVTSSDVIYAVNFVFLSGPPICDICSVFPGVWTCP